MSFPLPDVVAGVGAVDAWLFHLINRSWQNRLFDILMPILSTKEYLIAPLLVALLCLALRGGRRGWLLLLLGVAAVLLSDQGANLIKAAFHRTRPCHVLPDVHLLAGCTRSFSLPSNHASNMFAVAAVGWLTFRRWRWALPVLAAAVAYSRVYLGVHYPSDVVAGALWGALVGWTCTRVVTHVAPGWAERRRQPAPSRSA
ncbi:MAG TPA: phosphatase PAP2 family protein [Candidatus Methylomirabilis sp.]|nr:phosphatase PAP2 family protein [Candidatus Methylomirabilis sp.]